MFCVLFEHCRKQSVASVAVYCGVLQCAIGAVCCSVHRHHPFLFLSCYDVESTFLGLCMCMYMTEERVCMCMRMCMCMCMRMYICMCMFMCTCLRM